MSADLPPMRKLVAVAVALHGDFATGENVRPSMTTVAGYAGLKSRVTANRHVRALVSTGWLTATGKAPKGVVVYSLTLPVRAG
jgi:hypothetical protein